MKKICFLLFYCCLIQVQAAKVKKNIVSRVYHNITAHYNRYFNANEKYKTSLKSIKTKENFNKILPIYPMIKGGDGTSIIEKLTNNIYAHEISRWTDDSYLLIAKCHFLNKDYKKSIETLEYITSEYKEGVKNEFLNKKYLKRKKEKEKKIILKHIPARSEALIWMIRAYSALGDFERAESILAYAETDENFVSTLKPQLRLTEAELYYYKKEFDRIINPLKKATESKTLRKNHARYHFILGQLYQANKNYSQSIEHFKVCLKKNPSSDLELNANLHIIRLLSKSKSHSPKEVEKTLNKMARESKNRDFLDLIYYELAHIALSEKRDNAATKYLKKSILLSTHNAAQKGLSFLALAKLFEQKESYEQASNFYDSTLAYLPSNHIAYRLVDEKNKTFKSLTKQLNIIQQEKQAQTLFRLSEAERALFIEKYLTEWKARQKKQKEEERKQAQTLAEVRESTNTTNKRGTWYFDSPKQIEKGLEVFVQLWGERKLQDNWRTQPNLDLSIEDSDSISTQNNAVRHNNWPKELNEIINHIPSDEKSVEVSKQKMLEAYYNLANIYHLRLNQPLKSIEVLEKIHVLYPKEKKSVENLYTLYVLYKKTNQIVQAEENKNRILNKYPKSKFAQAIISPQAPTTNGEKHITSKNTFDNAEDWYQSTFNQYENHKYNSVIQQCEKAKSEFPNTTLIPQFDLLKALALGQLKKYDEHIKALNKVIFEHEGHPVSLKANKLLERLLLSDLPKIDPDIAASDTLYYETISSNNAQITSSEKKKSKQKKMVTVGQSSKINTPSTTTRDTTKKDDATTTLDKNRRSGEDTSNVHLSKPKTVFKSSLSDKHYLAIRINSQDSIAPYLLKIDAFNLKNFKNSNLKSTIESIAGEKHIIIRELFDGAKAKIYRKYILQKQSTLLADLQKDQYQIYLLSTSNYNLLKSSKNLNAYIDFYSKNY